MIFVSVFLVQPTLWPAQLMFCTYGFQNRNRVAQNDGFIGEYCGEYFLWRRHENDVTFLFGCYYTVTFSLYVILLAEDCRKTWSFKYQNLVFSFLTYAIILLFPPIYMVIEDSFMNYSYTANIYIYHKMLSFYWTTPLVQCLASLSSTFGKLSGKLSIL